MAAQVALKREDVDATVAFRDALNVEPVCVKHRSSTSETTCSNVQRDANNNAPTEDYDETAETRAKQTSFSSAIPGKECQ